MTTIKVKTDNGNIAIFKSLTPPKNITNKISNLVKLCQED